MFRLLLRSEEQVQAIASLGSTFNLMDDVHTNVIAGLAMDDGETIAAWLPDAEAEFGPSDMVVPVPPAPPKSPRAAAGAVAAIENSFFNSPDITVIGPEGKRMPATYVGFDAATGLSILRLTKKNEVSTGAFKDEAVITGEVVLVYAPAPVPGTRPVVGNGLYARIGAIEGRVQDITTAPSGGVARFRVRSAKFSHANIGGVATNEAGETIGIVDGLEGSEASILPAASIRRAARRVLAKQASVPRPWLGVKGEPITALNLDQMLNHGWEMQRAALLAGKHRGIMLTSILPESPAAKAQLRAGDVILKVDDKDIQTADDFTWWLEQAGPSSSVEFTVARPDRVAEEAVDVKLSGKFDPVLSFSLFRRGPALRGATLLNQGIETVALRPIVAAQLGVTAGLLVVYVEPSTAASEAGLQAGDVIQSIDGKPISAFKPTPQADYFTFEVVRSKQKLVVKVAAKKN